jgi:hypothetical protein
LKGNQEPPIKWTASVSRAELAKLYRVFVENNSTRLKTTNGKALFTTPVRKASAFPPERAIFWVTYGKNSPLSGKNLERYQRVKKALDDFVARRQHKKTENSSNDDQELSEAENASKATGARKATTGVTVGFSNGLSLTEILNKGLSADLSGGKIQSNWRAG